MSSQLENPENLLRSLPAALQNDESLNAMAQAISDILAARAEELEAERIYTAIDNLPEALLDQLAVDFKIEWWQEMTSIEAKRDALESAIRIHKMKGTRAVCEWAAALYVDGEVEIQEWPEYGGVEGYFKVIIKDAEKVDYDALLTVIYKVKRLSAWLEAFVQEREETVKGNVAVFIQTEIHTEIYPEDTGDVILDVQLTTDPMYTVSLAEPASETARDCWNVGADGMDMPET